MPPIDGGSGKSQAPVYSDDDELPPINGGDSRGRARAGKHTLSVKSGKTSGQYGGGATFKSSKVAPSNGFGTNRSTGVYQDVIASVSGKSRKSSNGNVSSSKKPAASSKVKKVTSSAVGSSAIAGTSGSSSSSYTDVSGESAFSLHHPRGLRDSAHPCCSL